MRSQPIPSDLALAVSLTLAIRGYSLFNAPESEVDLAIEKASRTPAPKAEAERGGPFH